MKVIIPDTNTPGRYLILNGKPFEDPEAMMSAFCEAIGEWLANYPDGRRLVVTGNTTIGDLVGYIPDAMMRRTTLGRLLRNRGFTFLDMEVMEAALLPNYQSDTDLSLGNLS